VLPLLEAFSRDLNILNDKAEKGNDDLDLHEIMDAMPGKGRTPLQDAKLSWPE